jgi:uncharacterized DUF497 family protein
VAISAFDWDDDNIRHIERHEFNPDEVEEVFSGVHRVRRGREKRLIALGRTFEGRFAFVVFHRLPGDSGASRAREVSDLASVPEQIAAAKKIAAKKSVGYQTQLRMWIAEGIRRETKRT